MLAVVSVGVTVAVQALAIATLTGSLKVKSNRGVIKSEKIVRV